MMRPQALDHVEAAVAIFEAIGHDRYLNSSLNNSGLVAMYFGRWDDAIERYGGPPSTAGGAATPPTARSSR